MILFVFAYSSNNYFPIISIVVDISLKFLEMWINSRHMHALVHFFRSTTSARRKRDALPLDVMV